MEHSREVYITDRVLMASCEKCQATNQNTAELPNGSTHLINKYNSQAT
jgi:hypothetical protein